MNLKAIYYLNEIGEKKNQEDSIWPLPETATLDDRVFIVCDGVGGSEKGEVASRFVSGFVGNAVIKNQQAKFSETYINELLNKARQSLVAYAKSHSLGTGMATTFSMAVFSDDKAFLAWCGDTRIYQIRNGVTKYKTSDHSLVNSLIKSGQISEEEALSHPQKNIILKAIRADDATVEADCFWINDIKDGDYFLLCTDGLLENIGDQELKLLLDKKENSNGDLVQSFQKYCLDRTKDNYSMYLLEIGTKNKRNSHKVTITILVLLLSCLIIASVALVKRYSEDKKKSSVRSIQNSAAIDSSNQEKMMESLRSHEENIDLKKDSLPYVEIVNSGDSLGKGQRPAASLTSKPIQDSIKRKTRIVTTSRDSVQKKSFAPKKNAHTVDKRDSLPLTSDSTTN